MENLGDFLRSLPQNKMTKLVAEISRGVNITLTLCHGKFEVPPLEIRPNSEDNWNPENYPQEAHQGKNLL